jgi:hypothetical protein
MFPLRIVNTRVARLLSCAVLCVVAMWTTGATGIAAAQDAPQDAPPPAYLAVVEGAATIERDGEVFQAVRNMPLIPGDRLRTMAGRVEIRFPDGTGIEVSENSQIEVLSPTRVRVIAGSIDRLEPLPVNTASASYLPQDLQMYGNEFDRDGSWQYAASYGYVWYPRVAHDWRPYYNGYWEPVRSYGWTWIGADRWSWPTHHYGRWGYAGSAWFWIPGRTFSAAWVSWGAAAGYVSWCPLGFDNRAVFALSTGYSRGWNGWTVLPRSHFGVRGYHADRFAVAPHRLPPQTAFVTQRQAPVAVPRVGAGARVGNFGATPRVGSRESGVGSVGVAPRVDSRQSGVGSREAGASTPQAGAGYAVPRQAPYGSRPTTIDQRPMTNGVSRRDYPVTVPRTTMPPPSYGASQVTPRSAPERVAPQYGQPQAIPRYNPAPVAPAAVPRVAPYSSRPSTNDYRPTTNDRRPTTNDYRPMTNDPRPTTNDYRRSAPTPQPQAAPQSAPAQRSAPAGGAPAGTATPRSGGEGRTGGHQGR